MKRKAKLLISALSVMLLVVLATTVATFSFADENDDAQNLAVEENEVAAPAGDKAETNIDMIIENSLDTEVEDQVYHIVEISSGAQSNFGTYCAAGATSPFGNYVLDGNKSTALEADVLMDKDKIDYKFFNVNDAKDNLDVILKADLIYISNDAASEFKSTSSVTNDLSEDLYDVLHTYALGSYKPLIIDNPTAKQISNNTTNKKSLATLSKNVFSKSGSNYYTFDWIESLTVENYFKHAQGSMYIGINGDKAASKWVEVKKEGATGKMAKVLAISKNGDKEDRAKEVVGGTAATGIKLAADDSDVTNVYEPSAVMIERGYNSRYKSKPKYMQIEKMKLADIGADTVDLTQYDMVVLEPDVNGEVESAVYKKLSSAMYANVHIVYRATDLGGTADAGDSGSASMATKYEQLFYLCAYEDYSSKYDSVMVTNRLDFDEIVTSYDAATAKVIADLINRSNYRGNGGSGGSSSTKFTVLEIQPCYPIDRKVAQNVGGVTARNAKDYKTLIENIKGDKGNYYTKPAQVKNGVALEEIYEGALVDDEGNELYVDYNSADPTGLAGFTSTDEYYAWEVTPAKVADALNMNVNDINVVHMSSEELCTYKGDILGNYDLIYIGGNTSALREPDEWGLFWTVNNNSIDQSRDLTNLNKLPIYSMYSHFGDFNSLDGSGWGRSGDTTDSGLPQSAVIIGGTRNKEKTFMILNGNDISDVNYNNLKDYINANMPVIVSKKAQEAFDAAETAGYLQNSIDPDSNMYKVLKTAKARVTGSKNNVVWGLNTLYTVLRDTDGGRLGTTLSGLVRTWAADWKGEEGNEKRALGFFSFGNVAAFNPIYKMYMQANKRPKLLVKSAPATYNQHDEGTKLSGTQTWNYKVTGSEKYTVELLIDNSGNSKFETDEAVASEGTGKTKLTWDPGEFFGPFYWQLRVTDDKTKVISSTTGIGYIKNKNNTKQTIKIMQILPVGTLSTSWDGSVTNSAEGAQGTCTLYFCPMCDQSSHILHYNAFDNTSYNPFNMSYNGNYNQTSNGYGANGNVYYGVHEHEFGIVKYDNNLTYLDDSTGTKGLDDWNDNLADQVTDLYDFDIDILNRVEFEEMAQDVASAYNFSSWTAAQKADKINNFAIAEGDDGWDEWNALTTDDERMTFIMQKEYQELANKYKQAYFFMKDESGTKVIDADTITLTTHDAEEALVKALRKMGSNLSATGSTTFNERYLDKIEWIIGHKRYSDFYNYIGVDDKWNPTQNYVSSNKAYGGDFYSEAYYPYFVAKDKELEYKRLYEKYQRYAYGSTWLKDMYNCIIMGPADNFGGDDITNVNALDSLEYFAANGGNMLIFHDLLTKNADKGSVQFTARMRKYFGMDRYMVTNYDTAIKTGENYVNYSVADDKHFISNLSYKDKTDASRYASWRKDMQDTNAWAGWATVPDKYNSAVQYTDAVNITNNNSGNYTGSIPYRYADLDWQLNAKWAHSHPFDSRTAQNYGTIRATKNNDGIVTLFPFTLADDIYIGGTHPQAYALDIESSNMTVWYSLAGCDNQKQGSSFYAADPGDGMDNYFIYSYGNVSFCGAGHNFVTGPGRNNNDERMLYINIVCNSVRKSINGPKLLIYDHGKETNEIVKETEDSADCDYMMSFDNTEDYPEFSFKVTKEDGVTLKGVKIYYDLDYSTTNTLDEYSADTFADGYPKHELIADWKEADIKAGKVELGALKNVTRYSDELKKYYEDGTGDPKSDTYINDSGTTITFGATALKLKPRYFTYYNNEYTYIVVAATYLDQETNTNSTIYKRIKIKLKPWLYDLT